MRATLQTWPGCRLRIWPLRGLANDLRSAEQHGTPPPSLIAQFRTYRFERSSGGFAINGRFFDLNVDNAVIRTGTYEVWNLQNDSGGWFHPVHPHLLHVGRNNESVRVLMQWPDVPVNGANSAARVVSGQPTFDFFERRYVFHCHNIDREDHHMMAQFRIRQ